MHSQVQCAMYKASLTFFFCPLLVLSLLPLTPLISAVQGSYVVWWPASHSWSQGGWRISATGPTPGASAQTRRPHPQHTWHDKRSELHIYVSHCFLAHYSVHTCVVHGEWSTSYYGQSSEVSPPVELIGYFVCIIIYVCLSHRSSAHATCKCRAQAKCSLTSLSAQLSHDYPTMLCIPLVWLWVASPCITTWHCSWVMALFRGTNTMQCRQTYYADRQYAIAAHADSDLPLPTAITWSPPLAESRE